MSPAAGVMDVRTMVTGKCIRVVRCFLENRDAAAGAHAVAEAHSITTFLPGPVAEGTDAGSDNSAAAAEAAAPAAVPAPAAAPAVAKADVTAAATEPAAAPAAAAAVKPPATKNVGPVTVTAAASAAPGTATAAPAKGPAASPKAPAAVAKKSPAPVPKQAAAAKAPVASAAAAPKTHPEPVATLMELPGVPAEAATPAPANTVGGAATGASTPASRAPSTTGGAVSVLVQAATTEPKATATPAKAAAAPARQPEVPAKATAAAAKPPAAAPPTAAAPAEPPTTSGLKRPPSVDPPPTPPPPPGPTKATNPATSGPSGTAPSNSAPATITASPTPPVPASPPLTPAGEPLPAPPAAAVPCVVRVALEGNPGGPCPVSLPAAALDADGSGEVMVADLVTAALKALKARYGPAHAGPSVKAFFVHPSAGERRWLPTFDGVPRELLAPGAGEQAGPGIVLQGITCGDAFAAQRPSMDAASVPLPGCAESTEVGPMSPSSQDSGMVTAVARGSGGGARVTFLSDAPSLGGGSGGAGASGQQPPAFLHSRTLERGSGGGAGGGGLRSLLGAGTRSSRPSQVVETLCVESAAPSATSVYSTWRGGKLPPVHDSDLTRSARQLRLEASAVDSARMDSDFEGEKDGEEDDGDGSLQYRSAGPGPAPSPGSVRAAFAGDLGPEKELGAERLLLPPSGGEGGAARGGLVGAALAEAPAVTAEGSNAALAMLDAGKQAPASPVEPKSDAGAADAADAAVGGSRQGSEAKGKASALMSNSDLSDDPEEEDTCQTPALEWTDVMGPDPPEPQQEQSGGRCLGFLSLFSASAKVQQQQQWRARLRAALKAQDAEELSAWLDFHASSRGSRDPAELDAALWLALEARAPHLLRTLLQRGARPDAPRPRRPAAAASAAGALAGVGHLGRAKVVAEDKWLPPSKQGSGSSAGGCGNACNGGAGGAEALEGLTPLMRAAELGDVQLLEVLLAAGAEAGAAQPGNGWTALHRAVLASPAGPSPPPSSPPATGKGEGGGDGDAGLRCAQLLLQRLGLQAARKLRTRGRHEDDLVRFAVRHGRSAALRWLLDTGFRTAGDAAGDAADATDDVGSCAYLAGRLGRTVEVWDLPPPARPPSAPTRDPARPERWLARPEEAVFAAQRRQLLMGAAAAGRLEVLSAVLYKPPPYDKLRREELAAALVALRGAQPPPPNAAAVEAQLTGAAHPYMSWEREVLPALRRVDDQLVTAWLAKDRPPPGEVDRALAEVLASERLTLPLWQDSAAAVVKALLEAGADVQYTWTVPSAAAQGVTSGIGASSSEGSPTLWPLRAALQAPAPAMVRQLLAAGADPRRRDAAGENALFFAVRVAAAAAQDRDGDGEGADQLRHVLDAGSVSRAASRGDAVAVATATECIASLLASPHRADLLAAANDAGLTPAFLAAVSDLRGVLRQLCDAGDDPWVARVRAPPGAPEAPPELLPPAAALGAAAAPGLWTIGHEAARCGALGTLELLLGGGSRKALGGGAGGRSSEVLAARCRDALIGAIRGGRVGAAKMALDAAIGSGSLYEGELKAALALCRASAASDPPLPPPGGAASAAAAAAGADPPRYEALASFLSSRAHVYMDWEREVMPALRSGSAGVIRRWISADRINAASATRALSALVDMAQQCNVSVAAAAAVGGGGGRRSSGGGELAGQFMADLANLTSALDKGKEGRGAADIAAALIKAGADVNFATPVVESGPNNGGSDIGVHGGKTLLMQAASKGHLPLVEVLIATGARIDTEDAAGLTAVDHAVLARKRLGDGAVLGALLDAYGERRLNTHRTAEGDTALMLAVRSGDAGAVQQLLQAGAAPAALAGPQDAAADATAASPFVATSSSASLTAGVPGGGGSPGANASGSEAAAAAVAGSAASAAGRSLSSLPSSGARALHPAPSTGGRALAALPSSGPRALHAAPSALHRHGSAVYLAAMMDNKAVLTSLLRGASNGEGGLDACRQEVQLGALHGGRLALLEASLGLPELLRAVPAPAEGGGGSAALGVVEEVCSRLAEQASVRLEEAQRLTRELDAAAAELAAAAAAGSADGGPAPQAAAAPVPLTAADVSRCRRYLGAKVSTLERLRDVYGGMGAFYGRCRARLAGLERQLEERREQVSARVRGTADAQVRLVAAQTRLGASRDAVLRAVLGRRDAALERLGAALERRAAGLAGAVRRAEAQVSSAVEGVILEMRKTVGRRLNEIDGRKAEGFKLLEGLESKLDMMWARKQRQLAGRPPALRIALNQRMAVLTQQLAAHRTDLAARVEGAARKMELAQRRAAGLVDLEGVRGRIGRRQQEALRRAQELAATSRDIVMERANELLAGDKHEELLRIVGRMTEEVSRQAGAAAAASSRALAALQAAFAEVEGQLLRAAREGRQAMQEHLSAVVAEHTRTVKALIDAQAGGPAAGDEGGDEVSASLLVPSPDVGSVLKSLDISAALETLAGDGRESGSGSGALGGLGGLHNLGSVEDMIEDVILEMNERVMLAFPDDDICDALPPSGLAPLLEADADLDVSGLGVEALREEIAAVDFSLPNLDVDLTDVDLSALDDDGPGGVRAAGGGLGGRGLAGLGGGGGNFYGSGYDESDDGDSSGHGVGRRAHRGRGYDSEDVDSVVTGAGRYHAADYGDRHEDDFAMSYS